MILIRLALVALLAVAAGCADECTPDGKRTCPGLQWEVKCWDSVSQRWWFAEWPDHAPSTSGTATIDMFKNGRLIRVMGDCIAQQIEVERGLLVAP